MHAQTMRENKSKKNNWVRSRAPSHCCRFTRQLERWNFLFIFSNVLMYNQGGRGGYYNGPPRGNHGRGGNRGGFRGRGGGWRGNNRGGGGGCSHNRNQNQQNEPIERYFLEAMLQNPWEQLEKDLAK